MLAILLLPVSVVAQHGTADNGYYPNGYNGDTWSGVVSSVEPATKAVSLVYTHHGKTAVFEGILSKHYRVQASGDKNKQQIVSAGISVGGCIKVYSIAKQTSDELGSAAPFKVFNNNLLPAHEIVFVDLDGTRAGLTPDYESAFVRSLLESSKVVAPLCWRQEPIYRRSPERGVEKTERIKVAGPI